MYGTTGGTYSARFSVLSCWYHILWVGTISNARQLVGRVWYHKWGLNWTNHDRIPAPRSLCCVFVLAKYRFRLKRLDFFAGSFEKSSKSLNCVGKTLQSSIHSVKRYQRVSQTMSRLCFPQEWNHMLTIWTTMK